jgi:isoleucyl-tRNA synthetase
MEYRETLNLPQTEFPMKASLKEREPQLQEKWAQMDLYSLQRKQNSRKSKFILHDGPPYANGDVHIGTAFNKISKDLVIKYKSMRGFDTPYVPGWDCHGMPIEHKVVAKMSSEEAGDRQRVRSECRAYAERFVNQQREQFKRLGVFAEWDNPYLTMDPKYQAAIVRVFGELVMKGMIYRGLKPVYWCTSCKSALAEAEVEYAEHTSPAITVRFEVKQGWPEGLGERPNGKVYIPIWTTTPWTLPANKAVSVHPEFTYECIESDGEYYILAKDLVASNWEAMGRSYISYGEIAGKALAGMKLQHPFIDIQVPVILGKHVTLEAGTGCVHTAPGHGQEDYIVGLENDLEVYNPVGPNGCFVADFPEMAGEFVFKANPKIVNMVKENLMHVTEITHSYPHCWRHRTPIIFRATEQWFMQVDHDNFRQQLLDHIKNDVTWIPAVSQNRIGTMVENRPDWCLSRQRAWGVPLPVFYCEACQEPLLSEEIFKSVEQLFAEKSADAWFTPEAENLVPAGTRCSKCGATSFRRETDILDVWFDSGVSHAAVLNTRKELRFPADLYLEGSDQHRGWFQVSLLTASATTGNPPYKAVMTHGYTVDGDGKKMSKSLGNFITAEEAISRYGGADILRLWVTSENIQNDVRFSEEIFKRMVDSYRRIRNSLRFLLGNLSGFTPEKALKRKNLLELDQLMLHRLHTLVTQTSEACDQYEFYRFYQLFQNFCATDLSSFYFDILKDRLYADGADSHSRLSAQTTLWHILHHVVRLIAPVLVHTAEETWLAMQTQGLVPAKEDAKSVHLTTWLTMPNDWKDQEMADVWEGLLEIRSEVMKKLEEARNQKTIRHSYEAVVRIRVRGSKRSWLAGHLDQLASCFVVSAVELEEAGSAGPEMMIWVDKASWQKCERCWRILPSVGKSETHPGLCERCLDVVEQLQAPEVKKKVKK